MNYSLILSKEKKTKCRNRNARESEMGEHFAILYDDGSFNVSSEGHDLMKARKLLNYERNAEGELVKVKLTVTKLIDAAPEVTPAARTK